MSDGKLVFDTSISTDGFESDLKGLQNTVNSGGYSIGKGVKSILGADIITKAVNELFEFGAASVDAASQMESTQKRVNDVFGSNADTVFNYGKEAKNSLGMAETAYLQYASVFGTFFKTAGASEQEIFQWSTDLVSRAGDLATYWGTSTEDALGKIYSALKGETEAINDFGVDVRVGALSQFTGKDMTGADQLTQLTAIYEKIMRDTQDKEGTFQKYQESFASQQQIFAANIEQTKAAIGEQLLPVATAALTAINSIFDPQVEVTVVDKLNDAKTAFDDFNTAAETAQTSFEDAVTTAENRASLAETYLNTLELLEGKEIKTDEDVIAINNAVTALNNLYPNLQLTMDPATGSLSANTTAIRENIAALQDLAMQKLFSEQWQTNANALTTAYDNLATATMELENAKKPLTDVEEKIAGINEITKQLGERNYEGINAAAGKYAELIPGFDRYFEKNIDGSWSSIKGTPVNIEAIEWNASAALNNLNTEREALIEGITQAQTAVDGYNQAIENIQAEQAAIAEKQETIKSLMQTAGQEAAEANAQGFSDSESAISTAVKTATGNAAKSSDSIAHYAAGQRDARSYNAGYNSIPKAKPASSNASSSGVNGKHYSGLSYVPFDGYVATLHVGESVLSASEARKWRSAEKGQSGASVLAAVNAALEAERSRPIELFVNGKKFAEFTVDDNSRALAQDNMRSAKGVGRK